MASELQRDVPVPVPAQKELWGSDAVAAMLRALDVPYLALNPGASFRGCMTAWSIIRQRAAADAALPARGIRGVIAHGYDATGG